MKFKKIVIALIIHLVLFSHTVYGKYFYQFDETILQLSRDANPPICQVSYSTEEWTNQNVIIKITSNKEIEQVSGFELSENKKVLTKEVAENENGMIKVRDFSGNYTEVEYNVSNIDKEAPQIIGCENGGTYKKPLTLDYTDNVEIKEINVDQYSEHLTIETYGPYHDSFFYFGTDRTATTLKIHVIGHPKNTKKYKYYINDKLYATTTDTEYMFTGLTKGTQYQMKVEAIDKDGNVLETAVRDETTSYYQNITSNKGTNKFEAIFWNLDSSIVQIKYAVWNFYDESNYIWYETPISTNNAYVQVTTFNPAYYASYAIHAYLYDAYGNVKDVIGFAIDFNNVYEPKDETINIYELTQTGNYQIFVSDLAGNETIYDIKVE